ncbi:MAG: S46 family peptidase [Bacteroidales bacterium]|nr:S46 family peptidase [Bacteroidales bacterium]
MRKFIYFIILLFLIIKVKADEGMWLLNLLEKLNMDEMTEMGMELTSEDIYSINHSSLKDAIVIFGRGCTGEIISDQGLILTNHHCGYDAIQQHSSVEHDYLKDGFWAETKDKELYTPDLTVTFLVSIKDVTDKVLENISDDMTEDERFTQIDLACGEIEEEAINENLFLDALVKSFFNDNQYILFVYEKFKDVRLVGTPPSSIGKFGADTDNWMWPRHTCDFSLFRVYADKKGNPAEYSEDNVPLKPKYFLPVSLQGYDKDDFTFILGYPGTTGRYMTSFEVKELMDIINPTRIEVRGVRQEILLEDMLKNDEVRIQYATKYSRSSNYWKFSIGQNKGLNRLKIIDEKEALEKIFQEWVNSDERRINLYGEALNLIENAINEREQYTLASRYISECFSRSCEAFYFSLSAKSLLYSLKNGNNNMNEKIDNLRKEAGEFYKDYNAETDKKVTKAMIKLYLEQIPDNFHPDFYLILEKKYKNNIDKYVEKIFAKSIFTDPVRFYNFLNNPDPSDLENDMVFSISTSISDKSGEIRDILSNFDDDYSKGRRLFMSGLMEMDTNKLFYPDANFTMRFTFGSVQDYYPEDAVYYNYYTTLTGIVEKEDPDNWEFIVPEKLKQLYQNKDYGQYAENNIMKTCFITNNDITGGNSGSPVLNGKGQLIGLAFDGNWEAMSGDVVYEPDLQRCINVDIRYILFIIDKFAGATQIIDELQIIE